MESKLYKLWRCDLEKKSNDTRALPTSLEVNLVQNLDFSFWYKNDLSYWYVTPSEDALNL